MKAIALIKAALISALIPCYALADPPIVKKMIEKNKKPYLTEIQSLALASASKVFSEKLLSTPDEPNPLYEFMSKPVFGRADDMYRDFMVNSAAADKKYRGTVVISGHVARVSGSADSGYVVEMAGGAAELEKNEDDFAAGLSIGQPVVVVCGEAHRGYGGFVASSCYSTDNATGIVAAKYYMDIESAIKDGVPLSEAKKLLVATAIVIAESPGADEACKIGKSYTDCISVAPSGDVFVNKVDAIRGDPVSLLPRR